MSRLQIIGDLAGLHVLIDGQPADADNDGFITVAPGPHHWAVLNSEDEVIAEGDVNVPSCFAATPTPTATPTGGVEGETATPAITAPPTDALGGSGPTSGGDTWRIVLIGFGALIGGAMVITSGRKPDRKVTDRKR